MAEKKERLFADFPIPSHQDWVDKITTDLKGADFVKKLVWRTSEGFTAQPFYRREDIAGCPAQDVLPGKFPYTRGNKAKDNAWLVRQNLRCDDASQSNAKIKDILMKGVDSLGLKLPKNLLDEVYLRTLLEGIELDAVELNLSTCQGHTVKLAQLLANYLREKGYDPERVYGSIVFDPLEKVLTKGKDTTPLLAALPKLAALLADYPHIRFVAVNGLTLNNAGAYCYQELGYALAWGNEYMQQMTDAGIPADRAASAVRFELGIGGNYFMEIAKFRAARQLWAHIVKQYGVEDEACRMHVNATTSSYNKTIYDSHVNLLRTQTEAMSAALAGVESIVVSPFDETYAEPNEFSERLARNQQLILKEESHFDKVVDPAGGSYFVEVLTDSLAKEAWKLFLEVEAAGGFLAALKAGSVQAAINETDASRHKQAAQRREFILGTNQYPNFNEDATGKTPRKIGGCCGSHSGEGHTHSCEKPFAKLETSRLSSAFENLRLQTEASGKRPVAFMLTIGNLVMRQARAQFSCNFLACAGYEVIDNLGFETVQEGVDAAMQAHADIVVLCSSDDEYAEYAIPAYQALSGRAIFIVAGNPACADDLKAAGIEHFIHVRTNQLETLQFLNDKLGIS